MPAKHCTYLVVLLLCLPLVAGGQSSSLWLKIETTGNEQLPPFIEKQRYRQKHPDSAAVITYLRQVRSSLYESGYWAAAFDSLTFWPDTVVAHLQAGTKYYWHSVDFGNIDRTALQRQNLRLRQFRNRPARYSQFAETQEKILSYYENNGYPFAQLHTREMQFDSTGHIALTFRIQPNARFTIDSLIIKGEAPVSADFVSRYVGVKPGHVYNESRLQAIGQRIDELEFLSEIKPYELEFSPAQADVYLYLQKQAANRFHALLGVLPNDKTSNKLLITGELNLLVQNLFGHGSRFEAEWKKLDKASQTLEAGFRFPFLFRSPFGLDVAFSLDKQDSTYLRTNAVAGIQYQMYGGNYLQFFAENDQSVLIGNTETLPAGLQPFRTNLFGVGYFTSRLDYKWNPARGYRLYTMLALGQKTVADSSRQQQGKAALDASVFLPLPGKFTLKLRSHSAMLYGTAFYINELFKLGSLTTIRGFDEAAIRASAYSLFSVEPRFLFEKNSAVFLFADWGYYQQHTVGNRLSDFPLGFGAGVNFETKAGIFSLNYALGRQFNNPVDIRSAKIHFGFINRF